MIHPLPSRLLLSYYCPARYPSLFFCSALLATGGPKAAINLLHMSLRVCAVQVHATTIPTFIHSTLPGYCIFHVHFHACAPCRPSAIHVPMSRSAVTLVAVSAPVPVPSHAAANMRPLPVRPPCPVPVPSHPLLHVHTHTHIVDSHPAAATATEHPVRGRVKARGPRGEAV